MWEMFPVFLKLLGVEEGDKHQFFVVLKSGTCLANNIVQNPAVELVVVRARILRLISACARSTCGAFSGLVEFLISASLIKGCKYADVTVRLLEGLGVANSKSDWLKQQFNRQLFSAGGPAELILKASRQISLTLTLPGNK